GVPHVSHSTVNAELNGSLHDGQRRSTSPPHWAHSRAPSFPHSSNHRCAAPHRTQNATQSPRTLRRSSLSQSEALPIPGRLVVTVALSWRLRREPSPSAP